MSFRDKIGKTGSERRSNLILALDFPFTKSEERKTLFAKVSAILEAVQSHLCAVKINHHLTLPFGLFDGVEKLVKRAHDLGLLAIMDCKANDIGSTNRVIAEYYFDSGFDALIANPFVGWEEGLQPIFDVSQNMQRGIILLVYMSHKASPEGYGQIVFDPLTGQKIPQYMSFAIKALKYGADGVVVGATFPEKIKEIHAIVGDKAPIYSPGIGTQGGGLIPTLEAGTKYLIVGRSIVEAHNPKEAASLIQKLTYPRKSEN